MLRALDPDEPHPPLAHGLPWRVDSIYDRHPLVTNAGSSTLDFVRVLTAGPSGSTIEEWGQMPPGDTAELCLCDAAAGTTIVTLAWFRPEDGGEYEWQFLT